jgi:hypothetical protein
MADFKFSRRTVLAAMEVLEQLSHAKLSRFILELGPQFPNWVGGETMSIAKRLNSLMGLVDQVPARVLDSGELLRDILVEKAISLLPATDPDRPWQNELTYFPAAAAFLQMLDRDGFTVTEGALRPNLPADLELAQSEDETTRLLRRHGLVIAEGHLIQALDALARRNWASANGQLRTFFDALLDEIALRLDSTAATVKSGQPRRAKLAASGFLSRELNEWEDNGGGFINGLVKRLHPQGAHPGLSDERDAAFRLHIVLLTSRLLLARFDSWGK